MRKRLGAAAVAMCAILGLACSEQGPVALVHVLGVPPTATTLEAQFRLGVRSAMSPQTFPAPSGGFGAETSFVVVLPQGSTGRLAIDLTARDPAGCVLASGSGGQDVSAGARIDLSIVLSPIGGPCGTGGDGGPPDGSADGEPDGLPPSEVPHVPTLGAYVGTASLSLDTTTIDTSTLMITGVTLPTGVSFDVWPQQPSGPELAVLHVDGLDVSPGATVTVIGARPLVVIAGQDIMVYGTIDASARGHTPGPGGYGQGSGAGVGSPGMSTGMHSDSGGGGGGFGRPGAMGGTASGEAVPAIGGAGGGAYGDPPLTVLEGGSGGGVGSAGTCSPAAAGAGGGAVQFYSRSQIRIATSGGINVGGDGGGGGIGCPSGNTGGGSGGGSGGALFLQAPRVWNNGTLAANGGGGGGGAGTQTTAGSGQDGLLSQQPASGGSSGGSVGAPGGSGGAGSHEANPGGSVSNPSTGGNAGGGGGGVGRIRVLTRLGFVMTGVVSPDPSVGNY